MKPGKVFDLVLPLDRVAEGYRAMDERRASARHCITSYEWSNMNLQQAGSQPSMKGPEAYFTGTVRIDPLFAATDPSRVSAGVVTFEPCARSAWHTHPLGQRLIVTAGCGRVQRWEGPIQEIRPGDVVLIAPGEKHWHGAAPTTTMTHIAIQESLDGSNVDWLEKVTDQQYESVTQTP